MNPNHANRVRILYKTILRLHKGLPAELQLLGDNYVKDEFKRHKKCAQPEADTFMKEWSMYALTMAKQLGVKTIGRRQFGSPISEEALHNLRDDQIQQLYELMVSARNNDDNKVD